MDPQLVNVQRIYDCGVISLNRDINIIHHRLSHLRQGSGILIEGKTEIV